MKKIAALSIALAAVAAFSAPAFASKTVLAERLVPAGTSLEVTFATGVDATTFSRPSYPVPALLNVDDARQLVPVPNLKNLGQCTVVVEGAVDVDNPTSRMYFRSNKVRCLDAEGNYAYEGYAEGYVVAADGKLGIARTEVTKGQKAQLVLTSDTGLFTPQQLGQVASSQK
jgi:hypothetical protein